MVRSLRLKRKVVCGAGFLCSVVPGPVDVEEHARYTTYGIKVSDTRGKTRLFIPDVSTSREFAERFAAMCMREKLSLSHVIDVLEDTLP